MNDRLSEIQSNYKLNIHIVKRMVARTIKTSNGQTMPGCSKLMIAAMIHFSHICSPQGLIEQYRVKDLELVLKSSNRAAYKVLKMLEEREFIKVETLNYWTGIKRIQILGNDFSGYKANDYAKSRYLNTNYPFFNYRENQGYDEFLNLSLYAMRLLLCLLLNYSVSKEYHSSFGTLCNHICIKSRRLIHQYLREIKTLFPKEAKIFIESKNKIKRYKYGKLTIPANADILNSKSSKYTDSQDTYYSTKWKYRLLEMGLVPELITGFTLHSFSKRIGKIVTYHLLNSKKLTFKLIENTVQNIVSDNYVLDEGTLTQIDQRLRTLAHSN